MSSPEKEEAGVPSFRGVWTEKTFSKKKQEEIKKLYDFIGKLQSEHDKERNKFEKHKADVEFDPFTEPDREYNIFKQVIKHRLMKQCRVIQLAENMKDVLNLMAFRFDDCHTFSSNLQELATLFLGIVLELK